MKAACSGPVGKGITIVIEVKGKFNTALCYTPVLDGKAEEQIRLVCDEEAFRDSKIRIMPDVHAGKGCTIGTTMTITDKVVPGMVGVDIGCGMETVRIAQREIDSEKLDALIRSAIPCGREVRRASHEYCSSIDLSALRCAPYVNLERAKKSIGTLGGGNHFIEADRSNPRRKSQSVSNLFITLRRQNDENTCLFDFPCKDRLPVRKRCPDGSYRLPELSGSDLIDPPRRQFRHHAWPRDYAHTVP